jgi:hypothetical protein
MLIIFPSVGTGFDIYKLRKNGASEKIRSPCTLPKIKTMSVHKGNNQ